MNGNAIIAKLAVDTGIAAQWEAKGEAKGKREMAREAAKNLKKVGMPDEKIALATGFSLDEIAKL